MKTERATFGKHVQHPWILNAFHLLLLFIIIIIHLLLFIILNAIHSLASCFLTREFISMYQVVYQV